jgi:hypothetical protein
VLSHAYDLGAAQAVKEAVLVGGAIALSDLVGKGLRRVAKARKPLQAAAKPRGKPSVMPRSSLDQRVMAHARTMDMPTRPARPQGRSLGEMFDEVR